jgi:hypothetical protein
MHPEFVAQVHMGYNKDSFYGDEHEWTQGGRLSPKTVVSRGKIEYAFQVIHCFDIRFWLNYMTVAMEAIVAVSLLNITTSTNLFCFIPSLLNCWVVLQMGEDEKMSHCLYFSNIL